jgi:hypothetical protein
MRIKDWNRGQLIVFFGALLLVEGVLAWKHHDVEAQYDNSAATIKTGFEVLQQNRMAGVATSDSLVMALAQATQELTASGPKVASTQRFILFLGGLVVPIIGLSVAWQWFSGKPRAS